MPSCPFSFLLPMDGLQAELGWVLRAEHHKVTKFKIRKLLKEIGEIFLPFSKLRDHLKLAFVAREVAQQIALRTADIKDPGLSPTVNRGYYVQEGVNRVQI